MDFFFKKLLKYKKRNAIFYKGNIFNYGDIIEIIKNEFFNLKKNKLCFLICDNTPGCILSYLFILYHKSIPILIDKNISKNSLQNLLKKYKPDYIFAPKIFTLKKNTNYRHLQNILEYIIFKRKKLITKNLNDNLAVLIPTSGTTGSNKYVRLSCINLYSNFKSITKYLQSNVSSSPSNAKRYCQVGHL